jgi:outer membrane protein TolC
VVAIPGATENLDLDTCIEEALVSNAGLRAVREGRGELSGQKWQAVSIGLPSIDVTGVWSRGRDPSFALDESFQGGDDSSLGAEIPDSCLDVLGCFGGIDFIPDPEDIPAQSFWRGSFNARWELRPGLVYNALGAAGLGIKRQEVIIEDAEHRTVESVMIAYYAVVLASEALAAIEADLDSKREFLEITRRRFNLGLSTQLDTLRAAVSYSNVLPQRRSAAQALRDAGSRLNILMGRSASTPLAVSTDVPVETGLVDPGVGPTRVVDRPDIAQLKLYADMMRKNRGAQKADHQPYVSADASYGWVARELGGLDDKGHDFWSASVVLNLPVFDGFLTKGRVRETEATIRRIELEREEALRQARLEIQTLLGDLEAARENLAASELNLAAAEDALSQVNLRYEVGKADYLSVLDVQAGRLLARRNYILARNRVLALTASLKRAMGFSPRTTLEAIQEKLAQMPMGSAR